MESLVPCISESILIYYFKVFDSFVFLVLFFLRYQLMGLEKI
jgi:hypothetical protein